MDLEKIVEQTSANEQFLTDLVDVLAKTERTSERTITVKQIIASLRGSMRNAPVDLTSRRRWSFAGGEWRWESAIEKLVEGLGYRVETKKHGAGLAKVVVV